MDGGGDHPLNLVYALAKKIRTGAFAGFRAWKERGFAHLAIVVRDSLATEVENALHPYLRDRLVGRLDVAVSASQDTIRGAALDLEVHLDRARQAELVEKLREAISTDRRGVAGLAESLQALAEHRASQLLVSKGFSSPGWRCDSCQVRLLVGRRCKHCGTEMVKLDDVVEDAVQDALAQSCEVEVCENPDLDVLGRIGALLRF